METNSERLLNVMRGMRDREHKKWNSTQVIYTQARRMYPDVFTYIVPIREGLKFLAEKDLVSSVIDGGEIRWALVGEEQEKLPKKNSPGRVIIDDMVSALMAEYKETGKVFHTSGEIFTLTRKRYPYITMDQIQVVRNALQHLRKKGLAISEPTANNSNSLLWASAEVAELATSPAASNPPSEINTNTVEAPKEIPAVTNDKARTGTPEHTIEKLTQQNEKLMAMLEKAVGAVDKAASELRAANRPAPQVELSPRLEKQITEMISTPNKALREFVTEFVTEFVETNQKATKEVELNFQKALRLIAKDLNVIGVNNVSISQAIAHMLDSIHNADEMQNTGFERGFKLAMRMNDEAQSAKEQKPAIPKQNDIPKSSLDVFFVERGNS